MLVSLQRAVERLWGSYLLDRRHPHFESKFGFGFFGQLFEYRPVNYWPEETNGTLTGGQRNHTTK